MKRFLLGLSDQCRLSFILFILLCLLGLSGMASAAVTVTAATGGSAIASNTAPGCGAAGTWTILTGPSIAEANAGEIGLGDIVLSAPAGFEFNTAAVVTILLAGNSTASRNINNVANGTSMAVTSITATAITFTVTATSTRTNTLTWQGIQVRPTSSSPLATGNITKTGSSSISGITATTNLGTLTEVASTPLCALAPTVTTNAASSLTATGATLNGTVSSNGASTIVTFEYGLTTGYGSTVSAAQSPLAAGASSSPVSAAVTGLTCGTLYHFRTKGVNSAGTTYGNDLTFTPVCPAVISINRASTNPTTANASVSWSVIFNTSVTGVDATDFVLVPTGVVTGATITSVSGSGTTWTVTANTGTGASGTLGLNLVDNDSIVSGGVPLGGSGAGNGNFSGQIYTVSPPFPTLGKTASTSAAVVGDVITFSLSATNANSVALTNVVLTDVLPTGMSYVTHAATLGSAVVAGQTITWTIPALPAGGSAQLTLAVSLSQQGALSNTVTSPGAASASASVLVLASAVTHFRLDEPAGSWTGAAGEVVDSGGTALHGRRLTTSTPTTTNAVVPSPTIVSQYPSVIGGFCNAGQFDSKGVVEVADSPLFDYTTKLSASAWIYPTAYPTSDLYSILSNDTNYEFHLNTSGKLYWWWGSSTLTSAATIPLNQWTHIAITLDSSSTAGRQRIYINGVQDSSTNNWKGTLATNNCNFYIGGDVATGAACSLIPARNFRGMIDEVKLYSYELSAAEVQADMTLGRSCSGTFDHIRIEHDGEGSVCNPETVTVKACLDSACSTLYPGTVTVRLSPTGWVGGDTFTLTNGVATRQLSNGTAGTVTLGTVSVSPAPGYATRCFNGSTESCAMNFAAASCAFDAIETGAAPKTRIYTKPASTSFPLDVVALSSGSTINTTYTGIVAVDLVDTSSSACPTGAGLNTAQNITFTSGDLGRKNVSFSNANAAKNVRVRMRVGSSTPACSTDNFAIRPSAITVATAPTMATPPSATASPAIKAGASFTLRATTNPAAGYAGTLTQDTGKLTAQTTSQDTTVQSGGAVGGLTPSSLTANATPSDNASYSEVGYLYVSAGAFRDDAFTVVDKNQPSGCNPASTCDCISDETNGNYLSDALVGSTGRYGCSIGNKTNVSFGRFIPDHFNTFVDPLSAVGMPCPISLTCPPQFNGFVYSAQPFPVQVIAENTGGGVTTNYAGVFARSVTLTAWDGKGSTITQNPPAGTPGALTNNSLAATLFILGSASVSTPTYTLPNAYPSATPPPAPTDIYLRAIDTEGVTSLRATPADSVEGGIKIASGRFLVPNIYGSELLKLPLGVTVQLWNGSRWVTSTTDSVTTFTASNVVFTNCQSNLSSGTPPNNCKSIVAVITPPSSVVFLSGKGGFTLNAPGSGNGGTADVSINAPVWLPSTTGRATFGIFKSRFIYLREMY